MPTAEALIEALKAEHDREQTLVESLSETERARNGTYDHWSAKDLVAHLNAWKEQVVLYLREDPDAVSESTDEEVETANAAFFAAYHGEAWTSILEDSGAIQERLIAELRRFSESDLDDKQRFPWQEGLPLWRRLAGWIFTHPWVHLAEYALERENPEGAAAEVQKMVAAGHRVSDDAHWSGALHYNAARILARAGALNQAFQHLEAALRHRTDLIEGSKQDVDLTALRSDERLAKLYASLEN